MLSLENERCDRCGARGKHIARKSGVYILVFCDHHYKQHHLALVKDYWTIESESTAEPIPVAAYRE